MADNARYAGSLTLKDKIIAHYDVLSPYYRELWGVHIHHGYWKTGKETKAEAQEQLIAELISRAGIGRTARILDVGCGLAGTAIYLSQALDAHVTAITISPIQIEIGSDLVRRCGADVRLLLMDAEDIAIEDRFDLAWSVEAISHLAAKRACFASIARLLTDGGTLVIADWFKSDTATAAEAAEFLQPIEKAMLVPKLETASTYEQYIREAGLTVTSFDDLSSRVARTWDLAAGLVKNPALWRFAATRGTDFLAFLQGIAAMRAGYKSGALVYGMILAQKR